MTARPLEAIDGGRAPRGWEELWAVDRWPLRELPHGDLQSTARDGSILFSGIAQPWLKEAAKRWVRARLLSGGSATTMANYVQHLRVFSGWLAERAPEVVSPAGITRTVLEDWLLAVRSSGLAAGTKAARVGALRVFLEEQWDDGLAGLPRGAMIHAGEIPQDRSRLPRGIEAPVFEQFIDAGNLTLLPSEQHRTVILLLAFTGLRISSIVTLRRDALEVGSDNHPYLRYLNVKLRREAVIPIGPTLRDQLCRQEDYLNEIYGPDGTGFLLPSPPASLGGGHHLSCRMVRLIVKNYVRKAEIRDSQGRLAVWVHPHRFRHHLGTSLVNEGIPLSVIQRVLDHASIAMTAHYAHLDDETVKKEMMGFHERVNIRGERIALPTGGPLEQAAWMKERIARAKQALPNGYCGLPLVQSCPHPNACLSCDNFLTDNSFRQIHERQLAHTHALRKRAEENENVRLVELLETDKRSLKRILEALDAIGADAAERSAHADIDVVELAARRQAKAKGSNR
ncbi:MAG: site-specific integrase [Solirubrobacteraceae bacterium]|jgi:site-specific recombinase XerD